MDALTGDFINEAHWILLFAWSIIWMASLDTSRHVDSSLKYFYSLNDKVWGAYVTS